MCISEEKIKKKICINYFHGRLLSAKSFLREGLCPPCHFQGRAFVRLVIFTGGLLSALSLFYGRLLSRRILSYTP
jgi:hypothetical protein